jgi:bifunctional DNA-binding transcriptional regulator/antitoxin component of YhaV-PrlF toxin-antitoxin module
MRVTSKGRGTIPVDIRQRESLVPGTEVRFELDAETVRIVRAKAGRAETSWAASRTPPPGQRHGQDVDRRNHGVDPRRGLTPG